MHFAKRILPWVLLVLMAESATSQKFDLDAAKRIQDAASRTLRHRIFQQTIVAAVDNPRNASKVAFSIDCRRPGMGDRAKATNQLNFSPYIRRPGRNRSSAGPFLRLAWRHNWKTHCAPCVKSTNHVRRVVESKILQRRGREA
jgi:hypothetical protein